MSGLPPVHEWARHVGCVRFRLTESWSSMFVPGLYATYDAAQMEDLGNVLRVYDMPVLMDADGVEVLDPVIDLDCWLDRVSDLAPGAERRLYSVLKLFASGKAGASFYASVCIPVSDTQVCRCRWSAADKFFVRFPVDFVADVTIECGEMPDVRVFPCSKKRV